MTDKFDERALSVVNQYYTAPNMLSPQMERLRHLISEALRECAAEKDKEIERWKLECSGMGKLLQSGIVIKTKEYSKIVEEKDELTRLRAENAMLAGALERTAGRLGVWADDKWIKYQSMKYQDGLLGEYIDDEIKRICEALDKAASSQLPKPQSSGNGVNET